MKTTEREEFPKAPSGKSPLEYFDGGFEGYQRRFYEGLKEGFDRLGEDRREEIRQSYPQLIRVLENQRYLLEGEMNTICMPCGGAIPLEALGKLEPISKEDEIFWERQMRQAGTNIVSGIGPTKLPKLDVPSYIKFRALTQAGRIAEEKNAQDIKPNWN
jgi:hypothetical protein